MIKVTVIDYGLGNLHSVVKGLTHVGATVAIAERGDDLAGCGHVVLPGVGAFGDGIRGLRDRGFIEPLRAHAAAGNPLIGICLGMQLLLDSSEEFGEHAGLGIIPGRVARIPGAGVKVPQVGWNRLQPARPWVGTCLSGSPLGTWAYFVHSYHALPTRAGDVLATVRYGAQQITAAIGSGSVTGFQFHPEKSGQAGLDMLAAYIAVERTP